MIVIAHAILLLLVSGLVWFFGWTDTGRTIGAMAIEALLTSGIILAGLIVAVIWAAVTVVSYWMEVTP